MGSYTLTSEGLLMYQCPKCFFIFEMPKEETYRCPKCDLESGALRIFGLYPSLTAMDLLYSFNELAILAKNNQKDIVNNLKVKINEITSRDYDYNTINKITVEHIKKLNASGDANSVTSMSDRIADILSLESEYIDRVEQVISGDHINRLCKAIVILSASFIEIMFKDYMEEALKRRTDGSIASNLMSILANKSIEEHISQLDAFLGSEFKNDIDKVFYTQWQTIKGDRNKLIHKNSIYLHWDRTKEVIKTAKASVKIFANLKNKLLDSSKKGNKTAPR